MFQRAQKYSNSQIEKEIGETLNCDWLLRIEKVTVLDAKDKRIRKKLKDNGYKSEIVDKIIDLYTK